MVDENVAMAEVQRMAQLDKYPAFEPAALAELINVAKTARDAGALHDVVSNCVTGFGSTCPRPAELLSALRGPVQYDPLVSPARKWKCPRCDNTGWIINYALWTSERRGGGLFVNKQQITEAEANALYSKIDTQTQMVYSGARKCNCLLQPA